MMLDRVMRAEDVVMPTSWPQYVKFLISRAEGKFKTAFSNLGPWSWDSSSRRFIRQLFLRQPSPFQYLTRSFR